METQFPLSKKGAQSPPQFSAHVCCGQTAAWMKMKLRMQVGLGPSHTVLDGDLAQPTIFGPCLLWPNGWMHPDATWYGGRARPRPHCARWGPSSPPSKKRESPKILGPCLLWQNGWMDQDDTSYGGRPLLRPHCVKWGPSSKLKYRIPATAH